MQPKATLEDTLSLMRDLRRRCEWDAAQSHESLRPYLIEEAHELEEALRD
jgi:NTP pyrophosphatase (non-canonical NTP hydrolase)